MPVLTAKCRGREGVWLAANTGFAVRCLCSFTEEPLLPITLSATSLSMKAGASAPTDPQPPE